MRFVFITDELPRPGLAGHLAMNHAIIAWLRSHGHDVTVLLLRPRLRALVERYDDASTAGIGLRRWRNFVFVSNWRAGLAILGRGLLETLPAKAGSGLLKRARAKRYGEADAVLGAFVTPEQSAWCAGQIMKMAPDAIFADTIFRAPVLREPALAQIHSVIIAHDLFHLRHRALRSAGYTVYPAELTREKEAGLLNLGNVIAAIQPEEASTLRQMCQDKAVCTVPMPAQPYKRPEKRSKIAGRLVFVGSAALPNLDGLRWLFAEVWPGLRAACPAVTLDLVGDCGNALPILPPGVRRLGRVRVLSPILHRSALAISPLRVGSGLKIKILDYARHGLITVATKASLEGFAADDNAPFIAVTDAKGFAEAVAAKLLKNDPASENRALDYVAKHYNVDGCFSGLAGALKLPQTAGALQQI
jgi:hypothetical protein